MFEATSSFCIGILLKYIYEGCLVWEFKRITFKIKFCAILLCFACTYWTIVYADHLSIVCKTCKDKDYVELESFRFEKTLKVKLNYKTW